MTTIWRHNFRFCRFVLNFTIDSPASKQSGVLHQCFITWITEYLNTPACCGETNLRKDKVYLSPQFSRHRYPTSPAFIILFYFFRKQIAKVFAKNNQRIVLTTNISDLPVTLTAGFVWDFERNASGPVLKSWCWNVPLSIKRPNFQ